MKGPPPLLQIVHIVQSLELRGIRISSSTRIGITASIHGSGSMSIPGPRSTSRFRPRSSSINTSMRLARGTLVGCRQSLGARESS